MPDALALPLADQPAGDRFEAEYSTEGIYTVAEVVRVRDGRLVSRIHGCNGAGVMASGRKLADDLTARGSCPWADRPPIPRQTRAEQQDEERAAAKIARLEWEYGDRAAYMVR